MQCAIRHVRNYARHCAVHSTWHTIRCSAVYYISYTSYCILYYMLTVVYTLYYIPYCIPCARKKYHHGLKTPPSLASPARRLQCCERGAAWLLPKMVLFQAKADSTLLHPLKFIRSYNFFIPHQSDNYFLITFKSKLIDLKTICEK